MSNDIPNQIKVEKQLEAAEKITVDGGNIWSPKTQDVTPQPVYRESFTGFFSTAILGILALGFLPLLVVVFPLVFNAFHTLTPGSGLFLGK